MARQIKLRRDQQKQRKAQLSAKLNNPEMAENTLNLVQGILNIYLK